MRFANKIFFLTFLIAASLTLGVTWVCRGYVKKQAKETYISKYSLLAQALGDALNNLESNAEQQMYNAGKAVALEDGRGGLLSTRRLKHLRDELGVTHLFVVNSKGNFIRSTNENPKLIPNLYSFCPQYGGLLSGAVSVQAMTTPIIPPTPEPKPYKFLSLPNIDRTRFIHVGLRVDFIRGMLSKILKADTNTLSLNLYAPNGASLGRFSKKGVDLSRTSFRLPNHLPALIETSAEYRFFTKVKSTHPQCCQCNISGISKDGEYYYVLESRISKAELNATLASIGHFFLFITALALIFSILSAKIISRTLVWRLERMTSQIREVKDSKSLARQVDIGGKDEIAQLALEFNGLLSSLNVAQAEIIDSKRKAVLIELATQVSHDIRSPLAALDSVMKDAGQLPEEKRLIVRSAVARIRDIANNLLDKYRETAASKTLEANDSSPLNEDTSSVCLLSTLIEPLITEKRMQYRSRIDVEIDFRMDQSSYGLFVKVQAVEFKRVLSNIINNAVEAISAGKSGLVIVSSTAQDDKIAVRVEDNGRGIPLELLAKLGRRGETHGKSQGCGLGLYHAKTRVESWGGSFEIDSEIGKGAIITMLLPQTPAPDWFVSELWLYPDEAVVILDDDASIHQVWRGRLEALREEGRIIEALHFSTPDELRRWVAENPSRTLKTVYLIDYELLGHTETGLSLAKELGIGERSILVTSRSEEPEILDECLKLGVRMIPKGLAGLAPIGLAETPQRLWDAILVDDDPLIRMTWKLAANSSGKKLLAFSSPSEFFRAVSGIERGTAIYLDQELGTGMRGDQAAARLSELGFTDIYLATGHDNLSKETLKYIKGVVGKESPWEREKVAA